jgi:tungstate transport system ATP-binding protein
VNFVHGPASILPLQVVDLTYAVRGKVLVDHVSFTIPRGRRTVILGPNGAGKTLLLHLCHGLIRPTSGRVEWQHGRALNGARRHAMVFQHPVMLRRSMRANLLHALAVNGFGWRARRERAALALERFGLAVLADRPARVASGGEKQRLALARAWALRPEVIFLDEPTSALDPSATRTIEELIAGLAAENVTAVMTTHDLGQARRLAEHVLFMHRGRLLEDSPADDFFAAPRTPEARGFLAGDLFW